MIKMAVRNFIFNLSACACLVLLGMKIYYMYPGPYSRQELREYRSEYRDLFEYELTPQAIKYWSQVIKNYKELNPLRKKLIEKKLTLEQLNSLKETVTYLEKILKKETNLIPQKVKDNIIFFRHKHIYDYLYELQAPVLDKT